MTDPIPFSLEACRTRAADLSRQLAEILRSREETATSFAVRRRQIETAALDDSGKVREDLDARLQEVKKRLDAEEDRVKAACARNLARIERAYSAVCSRTRAHVRTRANALLKEEGEARDLALKKLQEKFGLIEKRLLEQRAEIAEHRGEAERLRKGIQSFAHRRGIVPADPDVSVETAVLSGEVTLPQALKTLEETRNKLEALKKDGGLRFLRAMPPSLAVVTLASIAGGITWALSQVISFDLSWKISLPVLVVSLLAYWRIQGGIKKRVGIAIGRLLRGAAEGKKILERLEAARKDTQEANRIKLLEEKIDMAARIQEKYKNSADALREEERAELEEHAGRQERLRMAAHRRRDRDLERAEGRSAAERSAIQEEGNSGRNGIQSVQSRKLEELAAAEKVELDRLRAGWDRAIGEFCRFAAAARQKGLDRYPSWTDARWQEPKLPTAFPEAVYVADATIEFQTLAGGHKGDEVLGYPGDGSVALPVALRFPGQGSLFLGMDASTRGPASEAVFGTVLRLLTAFPPGKAKFLFIDPVSLGENFSGLMHLGDFDESLVGGRIWTLGAHIEKKLQEITEHIEKVIQKYLRKQYKTIAEYNREVGVMAEPYRFVVVADFPTGFSDLALERLAKIVASGPRCGVHTIIVQDCREKTPPGFDMARLKQASLVVQPAAGGLVVADESIREARLTVERAPAPQKLQPMLASIGKQSADANRIEVPFEVVAPKDDQWWSARTDNGIRVPLGRAGADRMLHLDLGRGTAQHALIAGKTGSGKSTLFHVMITNLASWFSPRELEFYLIDYKKGVEFKTYATNRLPHARVVAIESDREFGLSVLQRLDREFTYRAELYRKAGVQDFASYRREGKEVYLPRTLLLIDEFQEFFVEEDSIAQEASLLLDRIVRQGRAFGVHVILGSQTLGGSYSLAKATLGQMGVRIALQCNEADSYLILSDDNAAARLLSRPGDAIYNDMGGLIEGNNPFQVVWLPEEIQERHITKARDQAEKEGWLPAEPTTVFEGNVAADIRNNLVLGRRLEDPAPAAAGAPLTAWIGEANAIKGPTEVRFRNQGGSNLLVVGQQRDAALGILMSSVVSLAAAQDPKTMKFAVLDGSPSELGSGAKLAELAKAVPQEVDLVEYARVPQVVEEIHAEMKARQEGSRSADSPIFLMIHDLQRFRKLRQSDEFDISGGRDEEKLPPDKCLANILTDGPVQNIHVVAWCDSLGNLNRTFTRKTLKEFELRILFQMSPTDSAELIDSPAATKLGLHRGLLFLEQEGTLEKFRPYDPPDIEWLAEVKRVLSGRSLSRRSKA